MTVQSRLSSAVQAWLTNGGDPKKEKKIHAILDSEEYQALPYLERNRDFLTSSKLREYQTCPFHARLRYIDGIKMGFEDADYFQVGSALDLRLTRGEEAYKERYAVVAKRTEKAAEENPGKKLLTGSLAATIDRAAAEYRSRSFFPTVPKKRNVLFILHGMAAKAELDHFDEQARRVEDTKTTSSILTFRPSDYSLQLGFYSYAVEKALGIPVDGALNVVDKNSDFSRSHKFVFSRQTLMGSHHTVEELARQWADSVATGIWSHVDTNTEEGRKTCWQSEFWTCCPICKTMPPTVL